MPDRAAATDELHHGHSHSLAPLRVPELRHDPVEQHTRRTRPEEAPVDRSIIVFTSGARRSTPSIRLVQSVPEAANLPCRIPVSSSFSSPNHVALLVP